jgi:ORF6N domain
MVTAKSLADPTLQVSEGIRIFRGHRVLIDSDLAALYGVTTARLNQQFRRNRDRFPADFAFEIEPDSDDILMLQIATSRSRHGGRRKPVIAFTEHGAIMAATVLSSPRAVQMTVYVVRAFVRLRQLTASHENLAKELAALKKTVAVLDGDTKKQFDIVYEAILGLMGPPPLEQ